MSKFTNGVLNFIRWPWFPEWPWLVRGSLYRAALRDMHDQCLTYWAASRHELEQRDILEEELAQLREHSHEQTKLICTLHEEVSALEAKKTSSAHRKKEVT